MADSFSLVDRNIKIEPKRGELFINRSLKYLSPSMRLYGEEFVIKMRLLTGLAIATQDFGYNQTKEERVFKDELYYLIDINGPTEYGKYSNITESKSNFLRVLSWLREQSYYVNDYPFDSGKSGSQHVIILKLPINGTMDKFYEGKYTELYSPIVIEKILPKSANNERINSVRSILTKDPQYIDTYLKQLNDCFNSTLKKNDILHHNQYDIPPLPKNEVLRW